MSGAVDWTEKIPLGGTGIQTSRLGIGSSYGVSRKACIEAFDSGVNYFFWGSTRTVGMALAIRDLAPSHRDDLCVVLQCYARRPRWVSRSLHRGLEVLGLEQADVFLLGWHETAPKEKILEVAEVERRRGAFKHLAISSHQRPLFRDFMNDGRYGVFHVRYNAAHVGAEKDLFPYLPHGKVGRTTDEGGAMTDEGPGSGVPENPPAEGPGIVAFTVLRWGDLLNPKKMPPGETPLTPAQCYRFALSNPHVHVAISGPKTDEEMSHTLGVLKAGPLDAEEMTRVRAIGDFVYRQKSLADWFR
jgi:aryl-alcohol dehydrogenase-like predicted oxidoreductase